MPDYRIHPSDLTAAEALIAQAYADADPEYVERHGPRLIAMAAKVEAWKRREMEHRSKFKTRKAAAA